MSFAFAFSHPLAVGAPRRARRSVCAAPRMTATSRPGQPEYSRIVPDEPSASKPSVDAPEVTAVAAAVCEFMNNERVRDLAQYVVRFGKRFVRFAYLIRAP